ncbi:hypothetical protein NHX12_010810, partial [Muraenolepis orangiensis]
HSAAVVYGRVLNVLRFKGAGGGGTVVLKNRQRPCQLHSKLNTLNLRAGPRKRVLLGDQPTRTQGLGPGTITGEEGRRGRRGRRGRSHPALGHEARVRPKDALGPTDPDDFLSGGPGPRVRCLPLAVVVVVVVVVVWGGNGS